MEKLLGLLGKLPEILAYTSAATAALIALFLVIPGEQPEKALKKFADLLAKFSNK